MPFLSADCRREPRTGDLKRIQEWLKARTGHPDVKPALGAARRKVVRQDAASAAPASPGS